MMCVTPHTNDPDEHLDLILAKRQAMIDPSQRNMDLFLAALMDAQASGCIVTTARADDDPSRPGA